MPARSHRIVRTRDFIAGMDYQLRLTGHPVGGYARMDDGYGGRFYSADHARKAGKIWNETGILPAFQTDERVARAREVVDV